jgi:hypothetical protein
VSIFARLADGKPFDDSEVAAARAGEGPTRADTGALVVRSKGRIDSSAVVHRLRVFFRAVRRAQCEPVQPAIWLVRSRPGGGQAKPSPISFPLMNESMPAQLTCVRLFHPLKPPVTAGRREQTSAVGAGALFLGRAKLLLWTPARDWTTRSIG